MARIILLNGAGSAGKSSLAKALQAELPGVFLHVAMDAFLEMMPARTLGTADGLTFETIQEDGKPSVIVTSGPAQERALKGMRHAVAAMADVGCDLIVDEVMFDPAPLAEYRALLAGHLLWVVGVQAPLGVLEAREEARGDRAPGLARWQFGRVHRGMVYDFEIDTSMATPEDCARAVVEGLKF
ncbi:MAG: AAA family ATPase [Rhizomicrobium sp.]